MKGGGVQKRIGKKKVQFGADKRWCVLVVTKCGSAGLQLSGQNSKTGMMSGFATIR